MTDQISIRPYAVEVPEAIAAWNTRTPAPAPVSGDVVELLDQAYSIFTHCTVTDGSCCCGDSMENHANPMYCGHSPTDHGGYIVDQWMQAYAALQAQPTASTAQPVWTEWDEIQPKAGTKVAIAYDDGCSVAAAFMGDAGPLDAECGDPLSPEFTKGSIWTVLPDDHIIHFMEVTSDDWK